MKFSSIALSFLSDRSMVEINLKCFTQTTIGYEIKGPGGNAEGWVSRVLNIGFKGSKRAAWVCE